MPSPPCDASGRRQPARKTKLPKLSSNCCVGATAPDPSCREGNGEPDRPENAFPHCNIWVRRPLHRPAPHASQTGEERQWNAPCRSFLQRKRFLQFPGSGCRIPGSGVRTRANLPGPELVRIGTKAPGAGSARRSCAGEAGRESSAVATRNTEALRASERTVGRDQSLTSWMMPQASRDPPAQPFLRSVSSSQ